MLSMAQHFEKVKCKTLWDFTLKYKILFKWGFRENCLDHVGFGNNSIDSVCFIACFLNTNFYYEKIKKASVIKAMFLLGKKVSPIFTLVLHFKYGVTLKKSFKTFLYILLFFGCVCVFGKGGLSTSQLELSAILYFFLHDFENNRGNFCTWNRIKI